MKSLIYKYDLIEPSWTHMIGTAIIKTLVEKHNFKLDEYIEEYEPKSYTKLQQHASLIRKTNKKYENVNIDFNNPITYITYTVRKKHLEIKDISENNMFIPNVLLKAYPLALDMKKYSDNVYATMDNALDEYCSSFKTISHCK